MTTHPDETGNTQALHVAILKGGRSVKREVPLPSGAECVRALEAAGYRVTPVGPRADLSERLRALSPDVVFKALHGRWGEDGSVQGMLERLGLPYTLFGVLASALAMDKQLSKVAYPAAGIPVADSFLMRRDDLRTGHPKAPPYVINPYNEGSRVGVYIVHEASDRVPDIVTDMPDLLMVEWFVAGHELTVAVIDGKALTVTEIATEGWYDFEVKYKPGSAHHICPADLPEEIFTACLTHAENAHVAFGCRGVSRTDFIWDPERGMDGLIALETNKQPGITPTSLALEQAQHCGRGSVVPCNWLLRNASNSR